MNNYKHSLETKNKISNAMKGSNNPFYGKKHSKKTKLIISKSREKYKNKNHPCWKGGLPRCLDCNKLLSAYHVNRCKSCGQIERNKIPENTARFGKKPTHGKRIVYNKICFRSSWEVKYAKYLDKNKISWIYEPKVFNLNTTTYTPDFYLPNTDEYIEIKGYWRTDAKKKYLKFRRKFRKTKIKVLKEKDLIKLNVL